MTHLNPHLTPRGKVETEASLVQKPRVKYTSERLKKTKKTHPNPANFHPNWEQAVQRAKKTTAHMLSEQGNQQQRSIWCLTILMLVTSQSPSAQKDRSRNLGATHPISSSLLAGCHRKASHLSALLPNQYMSLHSIETRSVLIYQQTKSKIKKMQLLSSFESVISCSPLFFSPYMIKCKIL